MLTQAIPGAVSTPCWLSLQHKTTKIPFKSPEDGYGSKLLTQWRKLDGSIHGKEGAAPYLAKLVYNYANWGLC